MKKAMLLVGGLFLIYLLQGITITVDIEGNGDFLSIQEGINASTNGDTVLVYPGRYFENTDFIGKEITLASLEMTTGNRDYIRNTIIDGNQTGSCVVVNTNNDRALLRGFTLTNGIGYMFEGYRGGGGLFLYEATLDIVNCIIEDNQARSGGGINILEAWAYLEGVTIRNNEASSCGGGVYSGCLPASIIFSTYNRCNIYDNFSIWGLDFCNRLENGTVTDVIVDTFTVYDPWSYEFYQGEGGGEQIYDESVFDMQHAKYERVYRDLFVSPDGNDDNNGLSANEPLQTLNQALHFITADEDHPLSIHLAEGIYSTELNDQKFPINLRSYISIIGDSEENTIIELNGTDQGFALDLFSDLGYKIKNLTIQDGYANNSVHIYNRIFHIINYFPHSNNQVLLENLQIIGNNYNRLMCVSKTNMIMRNVSFENNIHYPNGASLHNLMSYCNFDCTVLMENCRIFNNHSGDLHLDAAINNQENHVFNIVNCEFSNNNFYNNFTLFTKGISLFAHDDQKINIVNSTFAGNIFDGVFVENAPLKLIDGLDVDIINSIVYDNDTSNSIILESNPPNGIPVVNVHHSIIEDGLEGVLTDGYAILYWDEETISTEDPLFMYDGEYPYKLQEGSPAIDAGSLELPEGVVLPEYDLAGNLRIRGNGIDIGAYEYNPYGNSEDNDLISVDNNLIVYPNPLTRNNRRKDEAKILWQGESLGNLSFEVFNIKGQKVKIINELNKTVNADYTATWDLTNGTSEHVSSGVYFVRVKTGDNYIAQRKITVVK